MFGFIYDLSQICSLTQMTSQYLHFVRLVFQHATKNRFLINFYAKLYRFGQSGATVLNFDQLSTHTEVLQVPVNCLPRIKMSDSDKEVESEGMHIFYPH